MSTWYFSSHVPTVYWGHYVPEVLSLEKSLYFTIIFESQSVLDRGKRGPVDSGIRWDFIIIYICMDLDVKLAIICHVSNLISLVSVFCYWCIMVIGIKVNMQVFTENEGKSLQKCREHFCPWDQKKRIFPTDPLISKFLTYKHPKMALT